MVAQELKKVESFYSFQLPVLYVKYMEMGYGVWGSSSYIDLGDVFMIPLDRLCDQSKKDILSDDFIPFAENKRRDYFVWNRSWRAGDDCGIVYVPRLEVNCIGYSCDFGGFLFCVFLQQLSDYSLWAKRSISKRDSIEIIRRDLFQLKDFMPNGWVEILLDITSRNYSDVSGSSISFLSDDEAIELSRSVLNCSYFDVDVDVVSNEEKLRRR